MKFITHTLYPFIIACVFGLVFGMIIFLNMGCQFSPDRENYKQPECFVNADCLYRAGKSALVCDKLAEGCRDALKEQRFYKRLMWCNDPESNLPARWDPEKCRLYLNQK